ncbi:DUF2254 domain-containing protein [Modestobacter altitudinis]|uniref:DUF2254 domain-containing protein n=1 Tax=Modestobacter altitudinis TaxID=2213158 RepID=UPI00110CEE72|nr:DUF2254 domain-containing protein [Modestobacter altitudinis]
MGDRTGRRGGAVSTVVAALRGALWPIPCVGVFLAIGLGVLLPAVDGLLDSDDHPLTFVFGGGAAAARDLLAAIAGSLISVTGLTFSLTVIALQLSSSQYSPRLLQTFVTDRVVQLTLAQLVLTFVYALTVLRTVRTESATEDDSAFVPRLSITVAYLLTLGSVLALVFFLGHLARALRVETMLRDVHDEATRTIDTELGAPGDPGPDLPPAAGPAVPLVARSSGFLIGVDEAAAVAAARDAGVVVRLTGRIGDAVVTGTPMAHAWAEGTVRTVDVEELERALDDAVRLDYERSASRDVAYGLRKIIDIAVRALSPGINDPTTAVHALSHASALLGELAVRPAEDRRMRDEDGAVRVVLPGWRLVELVELVVEEPLEFAGGQPAVLRRMAGLLREFAWRARGRGADDLVRRYTDRLAETALHSSGIAADEARTWREQVALALDGRWPAQLP